MNLFGPRTNNCVEGWHTRLKKVVGKAHPNLFEIIEVMKKEQASSEIKLQQLEMGGQVRTSTLFGRFKDGEYSLSDYLDAIKYQTGL